jgi:urease subunit gamma/beta
MHMTPRERERLDIFTAAELARRRRARGRKLNVPEAIAVISDEILECAWDGASLEAVIEHARSVLGPEDVMDGVTGIIRHLEVDALFPSGTTLVTVDDPIGTPAADASAPVPGAVRTPDGTITLNRGRGTVDVAVTNTGAEEVFARGMRLDIAAGTAVAWKPGETRPVRLVELAGRQVAYGFRGLVQGPARERPADG